MDYEKKYNEAIKRAKQHCADYVVETIFPELNEDEGDRIRRGLIALVEWSKSYAASGIATNEANEMIAWLEKQGEQKPVDKVEPKFKIGDKIRRKIPSFCDKDMQVARIEKDYYICNHIGKFSSEVVPFSKESSYELVEQNPDENSEKISESSIEEKDMGEYKKGFECGKQRVLKYPEDFGLCKKPAWSEEDEKMLKVAIESCEQCGNKYAYYWLKSLKTRYTWKPSDEQMHYLSWIANIKLGDSVVEQEVSKHLNELLEDLKKLRGE